MTRKSRGRSTGASGRRLRSFGPLVVVFTVALAVLIGALLIHHGPSLRTFSGGFSGELDPLGFRLQDEQSIASAAAGGVSHVLYVKSPGGVLASAARTARYRQVIDAVAARTREDPATLEAMVFVESAGRPDVIAGPDPAAAAGLAQILAETGGNLLGMHVDLRADRKIARQMRRASKEGRQRTLQRLVSARRRVDGRFDPSAAIAGLARYFQIAHARFGRWDLAVVSYHMGIGNLEGVLRAYAGDASGTPAAKLVKDGGLRYARVYVDSTPLHHQAAYRLLARFGDESANYYWKILAAKQIMALFRADQAKLSQLDALHKEKASAEDVLHPASATEIFKDPNALASAVSAGRLVSIPEDPARYGFRIDRGMGELAPRLGRQPSLYRSLKPEALRMLAYLAAGVRAISHQRAPLTITSAVRDRAYQRLLIGQDPEATHGYSLHTTGFAFDVLRRYRNRAQALALQFMLDRLQALNLIAWVREPAAIHVTVAGRAHLPSASSLVRRK